MSNPVDSSDSLESQGAPENCRMNLRNVLRLLFGISDRVGPVAYAISGFALMLLKYGVESFVIWVYTSTLFAPWDFLNPVLSICTEILQPAPEWTAWAWFIWTLPFLWIAISMSVRRVADAGASPWWGLVILVPVVNLIFMLAMCAAPTKPGNRWSTRVGPASDEERIKCAVVGVGAS